MSELKPCPFCDKHDAIVHLLGLWVAHCLDCDAKGPAEDTPEQAAKAWNTRTGEANERREQ